MTTKVGNAAIFSCPQYRSFRPPQASAAMLPTTDTALYTCCSSALEKNNTNKYKKQLNKLKKQVGMVGPKSKQTRI